MEELNALMKRLSVLHAEIGGERLAGAALQNRLHHLRSVKERAEALEPDFRLPRLCDLVDHIEP
jgi:hypothetical protein